MHAHSVLPEPDALSRLEGLRDLQREPAFTCSGNGVRASFSTDAKTPDNKENDQSTQSPDFDAFRCLETLCLG